MMHRRENTDTVPQRRRTPSFSSTLLDSIYRSIDEPNGNDNDQEMGFYREKTMIKKQRHSMVENWMEKQSSLGSLVNFNSTSSSSDSSSGYVFSSSEAESATTYKEKSRRSKPVRSMKCMQFEQRKQENHPKREGGGGGFTKSTKLKALKIYTDLKKAKQPISPGRRITSFLNSIFSSGNGKKVNVCSVKATDDVNFDGKSSSNKSCLSKTPSSSTRGNKRSVRFYPVSVIVDEDCRPCGHKSIYEDDPRLMSSSPNVQEILKSNCSLKEEIKNYSSKKSISEIVSRRFDDEEDDGDDALSYSSSDLFELDHLINGRYREELPVYETTNLKTNQAIANGFIL